MRRLSYGTWVIRFVFTALTTIIFLVVLSEDTLADSADTLDLQLQWVYPLQVVCIRLVDFDGDGINEILVGFNSDSARVGILDAISQSIRWQSQSFNGTIYTVAAGDRNNDGVLDIVCGGQRSDTSIGYIEVFDGPSFDSVDTASGFDEIVLSAAISARCPDSLPQIFLGTYYLDGYQSDEYPYFGWEKRDGRLFALSGENLSVEDVSSQGAIREILIHETDGKVCKELLLGTDYFYSGWSELPGDFVSMKSSLKVLSIDSSYSFYLHDIGYHPIGPYGIMFEALAWEASMAVFQPL